MGWDFRTCFHGIQEGLDSHSRLACQEIAEKLGHDITKGQTYIFTNEVDTKKKLKQATRKK